jgi:acetyltransferase EpsM
MPYQVTIPLLNPNEPDALLVSLAVAEGLYVSSGDILCTLETTKTTADLTADFDGYVVGLKSNPGQMLHAGDMLCFLAETPDWIPPETVKRLDPNIPPFSDHQQMDSSIPQGLRITQPAMILAAQSRLDLNTLPVGELITESMVRDIITKTINTARSADALIDFNPHAIIIYGGGGHGKMLVDLLRGLGTYEIVGFVDDEMQSSVTVMGLPVLGGRDTLAKLLSDSIHLAANGVGGIGNIAVRKKVFNTIAQANFECPILVHPTAFVEPSAKLAPGTQVFAHAYIGSDAHVGFGCIISTGAIVSHDCILGEYSILSPGAILAGDVQVGEGVLIGMSATVNLQVKIGKYARIGNGATVKSDIGENGIVRAGTIWPG